ncbi:DUF4249 domain-containing protein [Altibacter sp.]|uniref:DUF4249 domain-containing protein n=1 Tax=Altibacter sp. TaxID=2024823 RepID=UPI000C98138F|nr:DUF4249 domain-containing protein [Altibacter sp.]MAP54056.1 hypothetical protein [Altibacter sp.]
MKQFFIFFGLLVTLSSCEDVIDVDLNESAPRFVIEANIFHFKEQDRNRVHVELSETTPFFNNIPQPVTGASVIIIAEDGTQFNIEEAPSGGVYTMEGFPLVENSMYRIEITYNNEIYTATEQLELVPSLEFVEQLNDGGFSGEDIELKAFFNDPPNEENYYFFEGLSTRGNAYDTFNDQFFDGNQIFGFYSVEDLKANDQVTFYLHGVDKNFYNFMFVLLQQSTDQSDGPFETQPATVRGNIVNTTTPNNFPLGYFRISEVSVLAYTVQ